jgi:pimeloyl-ACP methyl ester carboxylesterase
MPRVPRLRVVLRWVRRIWITLGLLAIAAMPLIVWFAFSPHGFPDSVLQSDAKISVEYSDSAIAFLRRHGDPSTAGFLFYPGCPVPAESYAPIGRAIAERGYPAYIVRVPYRCATREDMQMELFARTRGRMASAVRPWVLAGHSRGGALASRFASMYPQLISGLALIGTTHPRDVDLSSLRVPVLKVLGTRDGVAPEARTLANAKRLPAATRWLRIEGGNHTQFGYYRFQLWDHRATITRANQQRQLIDAVAELLEYCSRTGS